MSILFTILTLTSLLSLPILLVIWIAKLIRRKPAWKAGKRVAIAWVVLVISCVAVYKLSDDTESNAVQPQPKQQDNATVEEQSVEITEDAYRTMCQSIDYKELLRYPEKYEGMKVTLEVQVKQVLNAEIFGDKQAWRAYTDEGGSGWYSDDEYYLLDEREEPAVKILEDDIVTVYGEFVGLKTVTRAITSTTNELPCINVKYIDFTQEEVPKMNEVDVLSELEVTEYTYNARFYNYAFLAVKNNSEYNLHISAEVKFYYEDTLVSVVNNSESAFESGTEILLDFSQEENFTRIEYSITVDEEDTYKCLTSNLSYETIPATNKEIVSITNNGKIAAQFAECRALFFRSGVVVGYDESYFTDDDFELKPGRTITEELECREEYDEVKFFLAGKNW